MKKKYIIICILVCILCGCNAPSGTFSKGTIHIEDVYENIMNTREEANWKFAQLQDTNWSKRTVEQTYHLDMTKVDQAYVRSSAVTSQLCELAFFKVSKKSESYVKDAIQYRIQTLSTTYSSYIKGANDILHMAKQGEIGQYYYFILGEDSKKVVNYIRNLE